ncbi:MAG: anti-sigma F factor [Firmicutes bacterium]|nr:anti-sigma F factor [Bacillota bacterium]
MEYRGKDYLRMEIPALSRNEAFARAVIAAFAARLDPTLEEVNDIKTAVSEAVTNAIIHGYEDEAGPVIFYAFIEDGVLTVEITDQGRGIADIEQARQPFYTSKPELERSGMGFSIMESFMDELIVISGKDQGTTVRMVKRLSPEFGQAAAADEEGNADGN